MGDVDVVFAGEQGEKVGVVHRAPSFRVVVKALLICYVVDPEHEVRQVHLTDYPDPSLQLAIDLVNTDHAARAREMMPDLAAARAFLGAHGIDDAFGEADLPRLRQLRAALRGVFEAGETRAAAERVNAILASYRAAPKITFCDGDGDAPARLEPDVCGDAVDYVGAAAGLALARVLCDAGAERLGVCSSETCRDAFVDVSKNCRKRFCGSDCARITSVRNFRKRARTKASA